MRRSLLAVVIALFSLSLIATPDVAAEDLPPAMLNVTWELVTMQAAGQQPEDTTGRGLTILFSPDGTVSGSGGCNQFTSTYVVANEGTMGFRAIASTRRACTEAGVMEREGRYFTTLQEVGGFVLDNQNSMRLTFPQQGLQLVYRRGAAAPTLPSTGGGGMAQSEGVVWSPFVFGFALLGTVLVVGLRRRSRRM